MQKKLTLLLVALGITFSISNITSAQDFRIGIGARISHPVGRFDVLYPVSVGGTLRFEYQLMPKFFLNVNTGFIEYKTTLNYFFVEENYSTKDVPLVFGAKVFYWKDFYALGEIGLHFVERKVVFDSRIFRLNKTETSEGIGLGYEKHIGRSLLLDIGVKHTFWEMDTFYFDNVEVGMIISYAF